jgi:hypothetical protein
MTTDLSNFGISTQGALSASDAIVGAKLYTVAPSPFGVVATPNSFDPVHLLQRIDALETRLRAVEGRYDSGQDDPSYFTKSFNTTKQITEDYTSGFSSGRSSLVEHLPNDHVYAYDQAMKVVK